MKSFQIIGLVIIALMLSTCFLNKPWLIQVVVLHDVTDQQLSKPEASSILKFYSFDGNNKWNEAIFNYVQLSDISLNRIQTIHLPQETSWFSNELEREKNIKGFQNQVTDILNNSLLDTSSKAQSSVYLALVHALNSLSGNEAWDRVLLVYSDLMENNSDLSFYSEKKLNELIRNPDSVQMKFEEWAPLPKIKGVEVHLIYQPTNTITDKNFRIVSAFYKQLLENKGAKVFIEANTQK